MAPTILDDRSDESEIRRSRNRIVKQHRHSSVINYVGRKLNSTKNSSNSSEDDDRTSSATSSSLNWSQGINAFHLRNGDTESTDSCSQNSLSFHNYSKRMNDENAETNETMDRISTNFTDDESLSSMPPTPSTSTSSLYDDLAYTKRRLITSPTHLNNCSLSSPSSVSSTSDVISSFHFALMQRNSTSRQTFAQRRGLIEIAMKTVKLLQKNRSLQQRLEQLQSETRQFVDSVMANPENAELRKRIMNDENDDDDVDDKMIVRRQLGLAMVD